MEANLTYVKQYLLRVNVPTQVDDYDGPCVLFYYAGGGWVFFANDPVQVLLGISQGPGNPSGPSSPTLYLDKLSGLWVAASQDFTWLTVMATRSRRPTA